MRNRTNRRAYAGALFLVGIVTATSAIAQDSNCYTLASLNGTYSVVATYGANQAMAMGIRTFDGNGNFVGTFVLNAPKAGSTTGERSVTNGTQKGTYTVNCNGTGVITRVLTAADGSVVSQMDDFQITGGVWGWSPSATSLVDAQRTPSALIPGGIFVTRVYTRLPGYVVTPRP